MLPLLVFIFYIFVFYGLYLIYCTVRVAQKSGRVEKMPWYVRIFPYTYLGAGWVMDVVFNMIVGPLLFLEAPWGHGLMFTTRCASHRHDGNWRQRVADWICDGWLNPFEDGHC